MGHLNFIVPSEIYLRSIHRPQKITPKGERGCVIPMHREVALGTLRSALKMAAVSPEEFADAL